MPGYDLCGHHAPDHTSAIHRCPYADPITQKPAGQIPLNLSIKQPYAIHRPLLLLFEAQQICNGGNY
ncbi:protein of unknown function [Cardinium endosymbiont cEper1 of Encarsia pergandiella]|nr:protein of unknown function [Cardinium endosymbiont cEper1 of Encarsia pergandiella]